MHHTNECGLINSCFGVFVFFLNFGHAAQQGSQFLAPKGISTWVMAVKCQILTSGELPNGVFKNLSFIMKNT